MAGKGTHQQLDDFLLKQLPGVDAQFYLDDVVLDYLVQILSNVNEEEGGSPEQFIEIITEYIPEFSQIERCVIYDWLNTFPPPCETGGDFKQSKRKHHKRPHLKPSCTHSFPPAAKKYTEDLLVTVPKDVVAKEYILTKYSQIPSIDSCHPSLPKEEPKKMTRYRDNQVVSMKGERYTVQKSAEKEDMKKTYINLKPLRKYRFH